MVNLNLVIERIEALKRISGDKYIAITLGLSPQDFSNRKKRGTLLPAIFEWAIIENIDLNWLMKGVNGVVSESMPPYNADPVIKRIDTMLAEMSEEQKRDVLKYAKEKKQLAELKAEKQKRKAG